MSLLIVGEHRLNIPDRAHNEQVASDTSRTQFDCLFVLSILWHS